MHRYCINWLDANYDTCKRIPYANTRQRGFLGRITFFHFWFWNFLGFLVDFQITPKNSRGNGEEEVPFPLKRKKKREREEVRNVCRTRTIHFSTRQTVFFRRIVVFVELIDAYHSLKTISKTITANYLGWEGGRGKSADYVRCEYAVPLASNWFTFLLKCMSRWFLQDELSSLNSDCISNGPESHK